VERICTHSADAATISERIKHWTRGGLLRPLDHRHPGSGRHRQFEWATVIDAAVLNVLSDDGLHVLGREDILLALMEARAAYDDWEKNKKPDPYFLIFVSIKGKPFKARSCYWLKGKIKLCESAASSIVVNLSQIFARLRGKELAMP